MSMVIFLLAAGAILGAAAGGAIGAATVGTTTATWVGIGFGALAGVTVAGAYAASRHPAYYYPVPYPVQYWQPGPNFTPAYPAYPAPPPRSPAFYYSPY